MTPQLNDPSNISPAMLGHALRNKEMSPLLEWSRPRFREERIFVADGNSFERRIR